MQALTIWPSATEFPHSCLELELHSLCSSVKLGERRKRLNLCDISCYFSSYFRGFRSGACELKLKCLYIGSRSAIDALYTTKKDSVGAAFALTWALDEPTVGEDDGKEENEVSEDIGGVKFANVDRNGGDDEKRVSVDLAEKVQNGNNRRINEENESSEELGSVEFANVDRNGGSNNGGDDDDDGKKGSVDLAEKVQNGNNRRINEENVSSEEIGSVEFANVDRNGGDDEGEKGSVDVAEKVQNGNNRRINVRALAWRLHLSKTADDVGEVLKKEEELLPLQVYSTIIRGFGKEKKLDSAVALYEWLKRKSKEEAGSSIGPNLFIYNSVLGAVKEAGKFDVVEDILNDMSVAGVNPNVVTCNTLMGIYIEEGRETEALQLFEDMPSRGVSPSPASYSTVLFGYRRLEDGFGALAFFVEARDKYEKGEIGRYDGEEGWDHEFPKLENFTIRICYQVMRRWLVKSENLSTDVLRLLQEMDKAGLRHGREEHERLIWACTREEHCVVAKELYARLREMGNEISLSVCNHLIWLLGKAKKWWAALEIYEDLLDKGPEPNHMSYELIVSHFNILLDAARKKGIWRWGVRLVNKMEEKGLKPGTREWNSVLVACSKASETSAAIQIFKRMVEQGEKPTIVSYGALLSALEKGKLYDEALQVWKHMLKVGVEPNLYAYTIMASIYAGQGKFDIVDSVIKEMATVGVDPTVVTFNAIISSCARKDHEGEAYEWFQRMKLQSIKPNEVTYEMLIEALAKDGKPRLAYELHLRALNEGLVLSAKAYDAVIQSSQLYGATIDVANLGPRPPERKKKVQIRKNLSEFSKIADVPRRSKPFVRAEIGASHESEEELHRNV